MFGFILFLSSRIPKDFLKRFTLYLFIPLFLAELTRWAAEVTLYIKKSQQDMDIDTMTSIL